MYSRPIIDQLFSASEKGLVDELLSIAETKQVDLSKVYNSRKQTLLHAAASCGRRDLVPILLKAGINVDSQDIEGESPLHFASSHCHRYTSLKLLKSNANVNIVDDKGWSPLHFALSRKNAEQGANEAHWTLIEVLILAGADINLKTKSGKDCLTRLHNSNDRRRIQALSFLHKMRKVTSFQDFETLWVERWELTTNVGVLKVHLKYILNLIHPRHGNTILHYYALKGFYHILKYFLDEYEDIIDLDILDRSGKTVKQLATRNQQAIDLFLPVKEFFALVKSGDDVIEAIKSATTKQLLFSRLSDITNITPLHRAAGHNHVETARFFISKGAFVDATDDNGLIPLHYAAKFDHADMIKLLVEAKSNINKQDNLGNTPLHIAALDSTYPTCTIMRRLGANANIRNYEGKLPRDLAKTDDVREVLEPDSIELHKIPSSTDPNAVYLTRLDVTPVTNNNSFRDKHHYGSGPDQVLMLDSCSDGDLVKNNQKGIKIILLNETDKRYLLIKERMLDTIRNHDSALCGSFSSYNILSIECIHNNKLWADYRYECTKFRRDFNDANECLLFHGSSRVDKIILNGFDERRAQEDGMFGAGIYFAKHSSKSNQYTMHPDEGCKAHKIKTCFECERKLIYTQVALGRSMEGRRPIPCSHAPPAHNSVTALPETMENLVFPEYVIYKGEQAYPLYVITYKIVK